MIVVATLAASFAIANAHSWVACTDYRVSNPFQAPQGVAETDLARKYYNDTKCFGYPRDWDEWKGDCFGCDRGYNFQASSGTACKTTRGDAGDYTPAFPSARYSPGQTVCVAHTVKNHVAAPCTSPYIPDHGQAFYMLAASLGTSDPSIDQFKAAGKLIDYDGIHVTPSYDYKGFQNSPAFCENPDKALGTACFQVPASAVPGRYTFLWYWAFNSDLDIYTSCWEADIAPLVPTLAPTAKPSFAAITGPPTLLPVSPEYVERLRLSVRSKRELDGSETFEVVKV